MRWRERRPTLGRGRRCADRREQIITPKKDVLEHEPRCDAEHKTNDERRADDRKRVDSLLHDYTTARLTYASRMPSSTSEACASARSDGLEMNGSRLGGRTVSSSTTS